MEFPDLDAAKQEAAPALADMVLDESLVAVDAKQRRALSIWASVAPRLRAYISATGAEYFST